MNSKAVLAAVIVAILSLVAAAPAMSPDSSAEYSVSWEGVTITTFTDTITIDAGNGADMNMYVYNTRVNDVAVSLSLNVDTPHVKATSNIIADDIKNKGTAEFKIHIATEVYAPISTLVLETKFTIVDLASGESGVLEIPTMVDVHSKYSSTGLILGIFANPLPEPFNSVPVSAGISFVLWIVIAALLSELSVVVLAKVFFRRNPEEFISDKRTVRTLVFLCVVLYGATQCLVELGISEYVYIMLGTVASIVYILAMAIILWRLYCTFIKASLSKVSEVRGDPDFADSMIPLMLLLGKVTISVSAFSAVLGVLGVNLIGILTGAGILGLALSFGAQSTISQFFGGVMILCTHPFKSGDVVRIGTVADNLTVLKVGIMTTRFRSATNEEILSMPNNTVSGSIIVNLTKDSTVYCSYTTYGVDYGADMELVKRLLVEAAEEHPHVVKDGSFPAPSTRLMSFDDSSITFRLAAYVDNAGDNAVISGELREAVFAKFKANGIKIPYPHVEIVGKDD